MSLKSSISSHVRISYRFYQFVTTRYTTDFYMINTVYLEQSSVHFVVDIFPNALLPVTCQRPWRSLGTWRALASWFAIIASLSTRPYGSLRAGRSRDSCWSRGTRTPRYTWDSWCGTTATLTARLLNSL